jgi:hypothetical protein
MKLRGSLSAVVIFLSACGGGGGGGSSPSDFAGVWTNALPTVVTKNTCGIPINSNFDIEFFPLTINQEDNSVVVATRTGDQFQGSLNGIAGFIVSSGDSLINLGGGNGYAREQVTLVFSDSSGTQAGYIYKYSRFLFTNGNPPCEVLLTGVANKQ